MSAPWASPGARRTGPLFPAWDHAADAGPYRVPAPHYGTDLGPARGHCYDEHLRCYGCGSEWSKNAAPCTASGRTTRPRSPEADAALARAREVRRARFTPEQRAERRLARTAEKVRKQREKRAAERERKIRALEASLARLRAEAEA